MWECGKVGVDDRWVGLPCRYLSIYSLQSTSSTLLIDGRYGVNKHEPQEIPVAILPNTPAVFVDRWMDGWMDGFGYWWRVGRGVDNSRIGGFLHVI